MESAMSTIQIGEIFRNPRTSRIEEAEVDGYRNIKNVTRGRHSTPADFGKGMPRFAKLREGPRKGVVPATWFHSKKKGKEYPDDIDLDSGYVMYYGDNGPKVTNQGDSRPPHPSAEDSYGISLLNQVEHLYFSDDRQDREVAPPILITEGFVKGSMKLRKFIGAGVLIGRETVDVDDGQYQYQNVLYHVALLDLPKGLDWSWVDDLRDPGVGVQETFRSAPASWRRWVEEGHDALSKRSIDRSLDERIPRLPRSPDPLTVAEEKEPDDGSGHVYAITNPAWDDWVKIGRARNAKKRWNDYMTYSPKRDYELEYHVSCDDRITAEKEAHQLAARLAKGRMRGEWFRVSVAQAKEVLDKLGRPVEDETPQWLKNASEDPNY